MLDLLEKGLYVSPGSVEETNNNTNLNLCGAYRWVSGHGGRAVTGAGSRDVETIAKAGSRDVETKLDLGLGTLRPHN